MSTPGRPPAILCGVVSEFVDSFQPTTQPTRASVLNAYPLSPFAFPGFSLRTILPILGSSNLAPFMAIIAMRKERPNAQCECGGTEEPAEQIPYLRQRRRRSGDPRP